MKSYTLKIRGGAEVDSYGKKAGKGALIQEEKSATLGVSQDQILFQAANGMSGNNKPCVCSAGFKPNQGAKAKGVGYEKEKSPTLLAGQEPAVCISFEPGIASRDGGHVYENVSGTLRATPGDNQMTVVLENHPNDSRVKIDDSGTVQTLTSRCGTGGGNVPMVLEPVCFQQNQREEVRIMDVLGAITAESGMHNTNYVVFSKIRRAKTADDFETWGETGVCNTLNTFDNGDVRTNECVICLQGNGIDRADTAGCNGKGWTEDVSYTLNTIDRPAVVYSFDSLSSNSMKSSNPNSGCREVEVAKCLDTTIPDPSKNQGGIAIVYPKITGTFGALCATDYKFPQQQQIGQEDE